MRKVLFFFIMLSVLWGCNDQADSTEKTASASAEIHNTETSSSVPAPNRSSQPVQEFVDYDEEQTLPNSQQALTLRLGSASSSQGSEICLPVTVEGFDKLIGFQYTIRWDSSELAFKGVKNLNLQSLRPGNFGDRFADRGYLAGNWIDDRLGGVSLPDGTRIYEVCFQAIGPVGTQAKVWFANGPTYFEVIDAGENILRFKYANGLVRIE